MKQLIKWKKKIEPDQADDALHYLSLILEKDVLASLKQELARKDVKFASFKVSDLIRASQIEVTASYVREVSEQLQKIMEGKALKPIILVSHSGNLFIADGYHRICACNSIGDEIEVIVAHIFL